MPWWVKLLVGGGLVALVCYLFPILDILEMCFYIVLVPALFCLGLGLISTGAYQALRDYIPNLREDLMRRVEEARRHMPEPDVDNS